MITMRSFCCGLSVCRSVGLSVCRSVGLSVCHVSLSVCRSVDLSVCRSVGLPENLVSDLKKKGFYTILM